MTEIPHAVAKPETCCAEATATRKVFTPRADIFETPASIVVLADMPGVDSADVEITLEKNTLTIHGRVQTLEGPGANYAEYNVGDYHRAFTLSDEVAREGIEASVKNGVLKLVLPKASPAQPRKIEVKVQ